MATVDADVLEAVAPGETTLTAQLNTTAATAQVRVVEPGSPRIAIVEDEVALGFPGGAYQLTVEAYDAQGQPVEAPELDWSATPSGYVSVTDGHIEARRLGQATVRVEWRGVSDTVAVAVERVDRLEMTPASPRTLAADAQLQLGVRYIGPSGDPLVLDAPVTWSLSDDLVARIDATGLLGARRGGRVSVTATSANASVSEDFVVEVRFVDVSCFDKSCCALSTQGYAYCFGDNQFGQLGYDGIHSSDYLVPVDTDVELAQIDVAQAHACGLDDSGRAYCWGENRSRVLGFGVEEQIYTRPQPVETQQRFVDIRTHGTGTWALTATGELWLWGLFPPSSRNDLPPPPATYPTPVLTDAGPWDAIAQTKGDAVCARKQGEYWCMGYNNYSVLGQGEPASQEVIDTFSLWDTGETMTVLEGDDLPAVCGLDSSGRVWCAGRNHWGVQGYPYDWERSYEHEHYVPTLTTWPDQRFDDLASGASTFFCGTRGSDVWCWGQNAACQLGWDPGDDYSNLDHTQSHSHTPVRMAHLPKGGIQDLELASYAGCIVNEQGEVWCWGLRQELGHVLDTGLECDPALRQVLPRFEVAP